jgi:hypothetical protein
MMIQMRRRIRGVPMREVPRVIKKEIQNEKRERLAG